jgi:hypothetical protein
MADPTPYTPGYDYSDFEASNPTLPKPGAQLDNDFANIATSIDETIDALKNVRRSDGQLKNGIVTVDSLSTDVRALLGEDDYLDVVGANIESVVAVAESIDGVNALAPIADQIVALGGISASIQAVGAVDDQVVAVAGIAANVTTVAGIAANVSTVAGIAGSVTAVAAIDDDVALVATNIVAVQNASANAASAAASAGAASTSATNASASATLAGRWATAPEDEEVTPGSGLFSAFNWYRKTLAIYNSVSTGLAASIHGAAAKAAIADADEFGLADSAAAWVLKKTTLADFVTSIFKTTRTIANARFEGSTFGLILSAFRLTIAGALTAARTITVPDRDITLGITMSASQALNGLSNVEFAIPAGVRRGRIQFDALSTTGTVMPQLQLGTASAYATSGYTGSTTSIGGSPVNAASGVPLLSAIVAGTSLEGYLEFSSLGGNKWLITGVGGADNTALNSVVTSVVTLADALTRVRINLSSTTFDGAGSAIADWSY